MTEALAIQISIKQWRVMSIVARIGARLAAATKLRREILEDACASC